MDEDSKTSKTDEEWKRELNEEQYQVCRCKGTEHPFSGKFYNFTDNGIFTCVCCGAELFDSKNKFDSGTGWPSFYDVVSKENVKEEADYSLGMQRIEVMCNQCGAHLGHVFNDGPPPTHLRYCINSVALNFKKQ